MRTTKILITLISLAFILRIDLALADGATIALHGNERGTPACITCHGAHGEGSPDKGFPMLAGLNAVYLNTQLDAFAKGERVNAMMNPIAQTLGQDERSAVTRYFAGLRNSATTAEPVAGINSAGARLATQGRWSQGLPACMRCHGAGGVGVGTVFPALAGQSSLYIENQLRAWQEGTRPPGPLGLMKVVASKLSAADIEAVAAYFSALPAQDHSSRSKP